MMSISMTLCSSIFMFITIHHVVDANLPVVWHSPADDDLLTQEFLEILDDALPGSRADVEEHLAQIKITLAPIIQASPKNEHGRLDDSSARYVLYRLFMERHGWVIKTFGDATEEAQSDDPASLFSFGESVPLPVQQLLDDQVDERGSSIMELSLFASMLEHIIHDETFRGLESLYTLKHLPVGNLVGTLQAETLVDLFMACYIGGKNVSNMTLKEVFDEKRSMAYTYHDWKGTQKFFRTMMESHGPKHVSFNRHEKFSFKELADILVAIVNNFVYWNNHQCSSYKDKLMQIEDHDTGRVRLLDFYRSAIRENGTSTFLESVDYLRDLGALDETNPREPSVVISNYLDGPSNCVARTSYYSVCCMDECADLYSHLEHALGKPAATPAEIIPVAEGLNSASMLQCRELPDTLRVRLEDIAARNNGLVALHGKDFAEWMHFAYPRECSNAKMFGPAHFVTIEEWMTESKTIIQASDADILENVRKLEVARAGLFESHASDDVRKGSEKTGQQAIKLRSPKTDDIPEDPNKCSSLTWTFLFCITSMAVLSYKLHNHLGPWKESISASAKLAERKLTDWAEIV